MFPPPSYSSRCKAGFPCACFREQKSHSNASVCHHFHECVSACGYFTHTWKHFSERLFHTRVAHTNVTRMRTTLNLWKQWKYLATIKQILWFCRRVSACMQMHFFFRGKHVLNCTSGNAYMENWPVALLALYLYKMGQNMCDSHIGPGISVGHSLW